KAHECSRGSAGARGHSRARASGPESVARPRTGSGHHSVDILPGRAVDLDNLGVHHPRWLEFPPASPRTGSRRWAPGGALAMPAAGAGVLVAAGGILGRGDPVGPALLV